MPEWETVFTNEWETVDFYDPKQKQYPADIIRQQVLETHGEQKLIKDWKIRQKERWAELSKPLTMEEVTPEEALDMAMSWMPLGIGMAKKVGEKLPKYAQSINLEKQAITEEAKRLELKMAGKGKIISEDQFYQKYMYANNAYVKSKEGKIFTANTHPEAYIKLEEAGHTIPEYPDAGWKINNKLYRDDPVNPIKSLYHEVIKREGIKSETLQRFKQTHKVTDKLSDDLLKDYKKTGKALKRLKDISEGKLTVDIDAARKTNVNAIEELKKLANDYKSGILSEEGYNKVFQATKRNIFETTSDASSEIGRALNAHKKMISETDHLAKQVAKMKEGMKPWQIEELSKLNLEDPIAMANFAKTLEKPRIRDYFYEYWYNSILSGPSTHVVNIASNTAWALYQVPHKMHTAFWDKVLTTFTGKPRQKFISETIPQLAGYRTGFKKGAKGALEMVRTAKIAEHETKWAKEIGMSNITAWERSPYKVMRKVAPLVSAPTRALRAMDVWFNGIAWDGAINSMARRTSIQKGLKGDAAKAFETKFKKNPPEWAVEAAHNEAKHSTFMDDPDKFTAAIIRARDEAPWGTGRLVIPFVNTISNLTKRGVELTPGLGVLLLQR
jgi:hypothetical protein